MGPEAPHDLSPRHATGHLHVSPPLKKKETPSQEPKQGHLERGFLFLCLFEHSNHIIKALLMQS